MGAIPAFETAPICEAIKLAFVSLSISATFDLGTRVRESGVPSSSRRRRFGDKCKVEVARWSLWSSIASVGGAIDDVEGGSAGTLSWPKRELLTLLLLASSSAVATGMPLLAPDPPTIGRKNGLAMS